MPKRLCQDLGYRPNEVDDLVEAWFALIHPADSERVASAVDDVLTHSSKNIELRHRMLRKMEMFDGRYHCRHRSRQHDRPLLLNSTKTLISPKRQPNNDWENPQDILNRPAFLRRLSQTLESTYRDKGPKVLVLQLTRYPQVKAALGARAAELLALEYGRQLKAALPFEQRSSVARLDDATCL